MQKQERTHGYRIDPETGCWLGSGKYDKQKGYRRIWRDGKLVRAHRWYYERFVGPIPEGMQLDHLCRNRACCNPDHLEPVTNAENTRRGNHAKLTEEQVVEIYSAPWGSSIRGLAERYGVTVSAIDGIRGGASWTDLTAGITRPGVYSRNGK